MQTRLPDQARASRFMDRGRGFTIIEVLISITVIAMLMAIMLPTIGRVTETARRVVCRSNMHQVGLAMTMWVDDHNGLLPASIFGDPTLEQTPSDMQLLHLNSTVDSWDGLGLLVAEEYLSAAPIFYCPSHSGVHGLEQYEGVWQMLNDEIVCNYYYRPLAPSELFLDDLPANWTLITDGLRTVSDYNHRVGNNLLKVDMSVEWFSDDDGFILSALPANESASGAGVMAAIETLDRGGTPPTDDNPTGPLAGLRFD